MSTTDRMSLPRGLAAAVGLLAVLVVQAGCGNIGPETDGGGDDQPAAQHNDDTDRAELPGRPVPGEKARIKEGLHVRPGVAFAQITESEADDHVHIVEDDQGGGVAYVTGPVREKLRDKDRGDVLMGHGFLYLIGSEPYEHGQELKVPLRRFNLLRIIWGDFEVRFPLDNLVETDTGMPDGPAPTPPYRRQEKRLDLPTLSYQVVKLEPKGIPISGSITLGGNVNMDLEPDAYGVFEGRIPFVRPGYDCQNPQANISAMCAPGFMGNGCAVDEDFCIEHLRMEFRLSTRAYGTLELGVKGGPTVSYPKNSDIKELATKNASTGPTIGPLLIKPGLYLGAKMLADFTAAAQANIPFDASFAPRIGFEYTQGDGTRLIHGVDDGPADNTVGDITFDGQAEFFFRLGTELGVRLLAVPAPISIIEGKGLKFRLKSFRAALEGRLETTYSYDPAQSGPVAGSCFRSRLFFNPFVSTEFGFVVGLAGQDKEFNLPGSYSWRPPNDSPLTFNPVNFGLDGNAPFCNEKESQIDPGDYDRDTRGPDPHDSGPPPFKIEASWNADTDVDLHVTPPNTGRLEPGDVRAGWNHPFDVCKGACPAGDQYAESAVYPPAEQAPSGGYTIRVVNADGRAPADVTLTARIDDEVIWAREVELAGRSGADKTSRQNFDPASY